MDATTSRKDLNTLKIEAFWIVRPNQGTLLDELPPSTSQSHVGVRTTYSGFEVDTERHLFRGGASKSFGEGLSAPHCVGDFPSPIKFGDSCVGVIESGSDDLIGQRVFVPHPHQSFFGVHRDKLYPLPDHVSDKQALLTSEMLRALHGVWSASPQVGDRILVVGSSTCALLMGYLLQHHYQLDVTFCPSTLMAELIAQTLKLRLVTYNEAISDATCVLHSSPFDETLTWAMTRLAPGARAVDVSYHLTQTQTIHAPAEVLARGATLIFSHPVHNSSAPKGMSLADQYHTAIKMLGDARLDALFDEHPVQFSDLPEHVSELCLNEESMRYQRVQYPFVLRSQAPRRPTNDYRYR